VIDLLLSEMAYPFKTPVDWPECQKALRSITGPQAFVLSMIWPRRSIRVNELCGATHTCAEKLDARYLVPLERKGLIERIRSGRVRTTEWGLCRPTRLIAVEAKLRDWRNALQQASDNTRRVDYSYAAFPKEVVEARPALVEEARRCGVGILGVDLNAGVRVVSRARLFPRAASPEYWDLGLRLIAAEREGMLGLQER
jgi:hypothetical protein